MGLESRAYVAESLIFADSGKHPDHLEDLGSSGF